MIGWLESSGNGKQVEAELSGSVRSLWYSAEASNRELLSSLRLDEHADELLNITRKDAELGRISQPVPMDEFDLSATLLHPRFSAAREKEDGSIKVRAVDHLSWSANGAV